MRDTSNKSFAATRKVLFRLPCTIGLSEEVAESPSGFSLKINRRSAYNLTLPFQNINARNECLLFWPWRELRCVTEPVAL